MKKAGKVLMCFGPMLVGFGSQFGVTIIGMLVLSVLFSAQAAAGGETDMEKIQQVVMERIMEPNLQLLLGSAAIAMSLLVGVLWYRSYRPRGELKLKQLCNGKLLLGMVCMGISMQLVISLALGAVFTILPEPMVEDYGSLIDSLIGGNVWLSVLMTVILAPLAEEVLFRGITLQMAKRVMPFMAANAVQALMFGIYHGNLIQGTYAFAMGLVFGFIAEYFHSIWASILLHACVNGSAQLLQLVPDSISGTFYATIGMVLVGLGFLFAAAKLFPAAYAELLETMVYGPAEKPVNEWAEELEIEQAEEDSQ